MTEENFRIDSNVVHQLGARLVTDEFQALLELIKNAYDARARTCLINIQLPNRGAEDGEQGGPKQEVLSAQEPKITIQDDGTGMDASEIRNGWLYIADSEKRKVKEGEKSPDDLPEEFPDRKPVGDKGLGRLGSEQLGSHLTIYTRKKGEPGYRFSIDWTEFEPGKSLDEVEVEINEWERPDFEHGTRIEITDLQATTLEAGEFKSRLVEEFGHLLTPFHDDPAFHVKMDFNGETLDLRKIAQRILDVAATSFHFDYKDGRIRITADSRLSYLRPSETGKRNIFAKYIEQDKGSAFQSYLIDLLEDKYADIEALDEEGALISVESNRTVHRAETLERDEDGPGAFEGEIFNYNLGHGAATGLDSHLNITEIRDVVRALSGIRVYRENFEVRMGNDWLGLGESYTGGRSYYELKPGNTIGYVELDVEKNSSLEAVTDREGFRANKAFRIFREALDVVVQLAGEFHAHLREGYREYVKEQGAENGGNQGSDTREQTKRIRGTVHEISKDLDETIEKTKEKISKLPSYDKDSEVPGEVEGYQETLSSISEKIGSIESEMESLETRVEQMEEQLDNFYPMVSLGITAESLSHEMLNSLDRLKEVTTSSRFDVEDQRILSELSVIENRLRKQLSHLDPSLKYVREVRHSLNLAEFLTEDYGPFWDPQLERKGINLQVSVEQSGTVEMNKGRLVQVLDNLLLNSQYWLKEKGSVSGAPPMIRIELDYPSIFVEDNGPGIDPEMGESIFDPFVTTKPRQEGRGLGLYIAQQLLAEEGAFLTLDNEKNCNENYYRFRLSLGGI